ncbi:hypothetical protein C0J52_04879 [Blattella germanica]|nr:hypothetical protein C0J52_04879 [Blattella germanica]
MQPTHGHVAVNRLDHRCVKDELFFIATCSSSLSFALVFLIMMHLGEILPQKKICKLLGTAFSYRMFIKCDADFS